MACMEHECCDCGYAWADNARALRCPKCGARVTNWSDESDYDNYGDYDDPEYPDDFWDDDPEDFWEDFGRP